MNLRVAAEAYYPYLLDREGKPLHEFYAVLAGVKAEDKNLEFSWLSLFDLDIYGYGCRFYGYHVKRPVTVTRHDVLKVTLSMR